MIKSSKKTLFVALMLSSWAATAANWQVNNEQSQLSFISTKKDSIAEINRFTRLNGQLDNNGKFTLNIDLNSVDTGIEIRDSRMKEFLFNVVEFPVAALTATVAPSIIDELTIGASTTHTAEGILELHGQTKAIQIETLVTKLSDTELLVVSAKPVIIDAADFQLIKGVDKLKELAGLPSISKAVPVSFYLTLNAAK